jgi:diguanylate cyclase (GGDEF)-like protein
VNSREVRGPGGPSNGEALTEPRSARRLRLLVAEDEPDARAALVLALGPTYEMLTAADGMEALAVTLASRPDVILLDLMMPKLNGFQVLELLQANPATTGIPVLVVSARSDDEDKVRGLSLGAVDYLEKPYSIAELRARVARTARLLQAQRALLELAETDPLTGLANRRSLDARLDAECKRARRYHTPLTCAMVDMDQLKAINDELGHLEGDRAIKALTRILREELRETDFGARYGGDEFVVLLPHTGAREGRVYAERVCAKLRELPFKSDGRHATLGACFGLACQAPGSPDDGETLLAAADQALYRAKRAGRGRIEVTESLLASAAAP